MALSKRVTGIGGIFFKAQDPKKMYDWYEKHLGIKRQPNFPMVLFPWREKDNPSKENMTVWSLFPANTKYFQPSQSPFMLNYIVEDLDGLLEALRAEGVTIDKSAADENGKFAWVMDPEGNRIELWQPPKK